MNIKKPTAKQLRPLLKEAIANQTLAEYTSKFLRGVLVILKREPLRYRAYGPYWWLVKQALIDNGMGWSDNYVDAEWLEYTQYEQPELGLLAAWSHSEVQLNRGAELDQIHVLGTDSGLIDYLLVDEAMELKAQVKLMKNNCFEC